MLNPKVRKLARQCVSLRRRKDEIGSQLDQIDAERAAAKGAGQKLCEDRLKQYAALDAEYDRFFIPLYDACEAIVTVEPMLSICDLILKLKLTLERASLGIDILPDIELLYRQAMEWKRVAPIEWP